jgi:hypothetical protein
MDSNQLMQGFLDAKAGVPDSIHKADEWRQGFALWHADRPFRRFNRIARQITKITPGWDYETIVGTKAEMAAFIGRVAEEIQISRLPWLFQPARQQQLLLYLSDLKEIFDGVQE